MKRREFIAALGGAAAWPVVTRAQQPVKVWRVGYLTPSSANNFTVPFLDDFRLKLNDLGYVEGRNLGLYIRRANDDDARLPGLASELVSLAPHVIVGVGTNATLALQRATSSIPIVMATSSDPIGLGLVKSLAKPGGNITGLSNQGLDFTAKTLELLHVAFPNARRIAVLMSPLSPIHEGMVKEAYGAARRLGLTIIPVTARTSDDLGDAFAKMHTENCDALFVLPEYPRRIVELASEWRLPAIYEIGDSVDMGGLLSYGPDLHEQFRQAAVYVDKILKGANPADLPIEQPTKFELEINLKTAKALGVIIPDSVLARADKVIE